MEVLQRGRRESLVEMVDEEVTIRREGPRNEGDTPGDRAAEPRDRAAMTGAEAAGWPRDPDQGVSQRDAAEEALGDWRWRGQPEKRDSGSRAGGEHTLGWDRRQEGTGARPKFRNLSEEPLSSARGEKGGKMMSSAAMDEDQLAGTRVTNGKGLQDRLSSAPTGKGGKTVAAAISPAQIAAALQAVAAAREKGGVDPAMDGLAAALCDLEVGLDEGGDSGKVKGRRGDMPLDRAGGDQTDKPIIKPTKFDGTGDLSDYFCHFDLCVKANGWTEAESGMFLGLSLGGQARRLLTGLKPATAAGYRQLRTALMLRFEPPKQTETYKMLLRTRKRKEGEDMQALQEDLTKYTRMAYPEADAKTVDALVLDKFLLALGDNRLRQWVYQMQPADLQTAVMTAISAEAYLTADGDDRQKVRGADATVSEHIKSSVDRMDKIAAAVEGLSKKVDQGAGGGGAAPRRRPQNSACYFCLKEGHYKRDCPLKQQQEAGTPTSTKPAAAAPAAGN